MEWRSRLARASPYPWGAKESGKLQAERMENKNYNERGNDYSSEESGQHPNRRPSPSSGATNFLTHWKPKRVNQHISVMVCHVPRRTARTAKRPTPRRCTKAARATAEDVFY